MVASQDEAVHVASKLGACAAVPPPDSARNRRHWITASNVGDIASQSHTFGW